MRLCFSQRVCVWLCEGARGSSLRSVNGRIRTCVWRVKEVLPAIDPRTSHTMSFFTHIVGSKNCFVRLSGEVWRTKEEDRDWNWAISLLDRWLLWPQLWASDAQKSPRSSFPRIKKESTIRPIKEGRRYREGICWSCWGERINLLAHLIVAPILSEKLPRGDCCVFVA